MPRWSKSYWLVRDGQGRVCTRILLLRGAARTILKWWSGTLRRHAALKVTSWALSSNELM